MGHSVVMANVVPGDQTVAGTSPLTLAQTGAMLHMCVWYNVTG
jgi:hypothetical protein